jgi:hypothetical protein
MTVVRRILVMFSISLRIHARVGLSFFLCTLAACSTDAASGDPAAQPPANAVPAVCPAGVAYEDLAGKPLVRLDINGKMRSFAIDTGAPTTAVDESALADLGPGPYTFELDAVSVTLPSVRGVPGLAAQFQSADLVGLIGRDVWGKGVLTIDYPRRRFILTESADDAALAVCAHVAGDPRTVPTTFVTHGYPLVEGAVEGRSGFFILDSGASLASMPDPEFAAIDAAAPRPAVEGFYMPLAWGEYWARLSVLRSMTVADRTVENVTVRTMPTEAFSFVRGDVLAGKPFLGLLPSAFLRHFMMTIDARKKTVRLDAARDDAMREPLYYATGIGLETTAGVPLHVTQVIANSDAALKGVEVGDEIVSIAGQPIASVPAYGRAWYTVSKQPNDVRDFVVRRGGREIPVRLATTALFAR